MTAAAHLSAAKLSLGARMALHAGSIYICRYAYSALPLVDQITGLDIKNMTGCHYQFLTICSLQLTEIAMWFALAVDLVPEFRILSSIKGAFMSLALPMEILVSVLYWSLQMMDPDLVAPPLTMLKTIVMPYLPDLAMHAAPPVLLLLDYLLFSRRISQRLTPLSMSLFSSISYATWVEYCAARNGMFPYPILGLVPTWGRFAIYGFGAVINFSGRHLCDALHRAIWADDVPVAVSLHEDSEAMQEKARLRLQA